MVGVGRGAQAGVLIKNAEALERLEKIDTLVVDKTGTLTEGKPKVVAVETVAGLSSEDDLLRIAAALEKSSEHPLAAAIVRAAEEASLTFPAVGAFRVDDRQRRDRRRSKARSRHRQREAFRRLGRQDRRTRSPSRRSCAPRARRPCSLRLTASLPA